MKRSIVLMLAVCAMTFLCACGSGSSNKLVMATNAAFPPYEFVDGSEIIGIDAEIAKQDAEETAAEETEAAKEEEAAEETPAEDTAE